MWGCTRSLSVKTLLNARNRLQLRSGSTRTHTAAVRLPFSGRAGPWLSRGERLHMYRQQRRNQPNSYSSDSKKQIADQSTWTSVACAGLVFTTAERMKQAVKSTISGRDQHSHTTSSKATLFVTCGAVVVAGWRTCAHTYPFGSAYTAPTWRLALSAPCPRPCRVYSYCTGCNFSPCQGVRLCRGVNLRNFVG